MCGRGGRGHGRSCAATGRGLWMLREKGEGGGVRGGFGGALGHAKRHSKRWVGWGWQLRSPGLCRRLKQHGLTWADALPVFETVGSLKEIEDAIADPAGFLATVAEAGGAVGMKLALAKARPALEPKSRRERLRGRSFCVARGLVASPRGVT